MNKYYQDLYFYIESVLLPELLVHEILYLYSNNRLDISLFKLTNKIKKIINIRDINYLKVKRLTYNLLLSKYNFRIIKYKPIIISYVEDR